MNLTNQSFRRWWRPPRKISERASERRVTFLELFYDLVYVVLIAEVGHSLAAHVSLGGILQSSFLFVLVWLAWINGTMYHELHGHNDVRTRVFTFAQMFTVASMAVFAHGAFGQGAVGFALSFAAYQLILTYLWWRTGVHDPEHRPLSQPYTAVFLVSTVLFAASAFVPETWRFGLWGVALFLSVAIPLVTFVLGSRDPRVAAELERSFEASPSGVERFGLLTIIVLGEVIVGVVRGVAGHHSLNWVVGATAMLGMLIAIGLWWLYFDYVAGRLPRARGGTLEWMYLHLPATAGIVASGAATLRVVEHAGEPLPTEVRWLLVATVSMTLISVALLMRTLELPTEHQPLYRIAAVITVASATAILGLGFTSLPTIPMLVAINLLMLLPVLWGLKVWIDMFGADEQLTAHSS